MIRILITGGTGFFGRAILRYLILNNQPQKLSIAILSRNPKLFLTSYPEFAGIPWIKVYKGDILNDLKSINCNNQFTHIIHAAADSTINPKFSKIDRYNQIVEGTKNLLEFAVANNIKKFLYVSSGDVYGQKPVKLKFVPETYMGALDTLAINNVYAMSKRIAEHLCSLYQDKYGLECTIARCFSFVGPDLPSNSHFAIGNFIRDALVNSEIIVKGDGTPIRSYLYQDDLAEWLLTILMKGKSGEIYNVGSDEFVSIHKLAKIVRDIVSPEKNVKIVGNNTIDIKIRNRYIPNILKAKNSLNLIVKTPLSLAIKITSEKYKI
jgi:dTDP-glucose 4,6-dehydratase